MKIERVDGKVNSQSKFHSGFYFENLLFIAISIVSIFFNFFCKSTLEILLELWYDRCEP